MTKSDPYVTTMHNIYTINPSVIEKGDPDCKEKKKFEKFLKVYTDNLCAANTNIAIFEEMLKPEYEKLNYKSPVFYSYVLYSCVSTAIITLNAFFSKDSAGLSKFRKYIKENYTKIFTKELYQEKIGFPDSKEKIDTGTFIDHLDRFNLTLAQNGALISKIKNVRNKVYAHFDKETMLKNKTNFNCTLQDLKHAATLIAELINIFAIYYNHTLISFDIVEQSDIQNLLGCISDISGNPSITNQEDPQSNT